MKEIAQAIVGSFLLLFGAFMGYMIGCTDTPEEIFAAFFVVIIASCAIVLGSIITLVITALTEK